MPNQYPTHAILYGILAKLRTDRIKSDTQDIVCFFYRNRESPLIKRTDIAFDNPSGCPTCEQIQDTLSSLRESQIICHIEPSFREYHLNKEALKICFSAYQDRLKKKPISKKQLEELARLSQQFEKEFGLKDSTSNYPV